MSRSLLTRPAVMGCLAAGTLLAVSVGAWSQGNAPVIPGKAVVVVDQAAAERGKQNLLTRPYGSAWLDQDTLDKLWTVWEADAKAKINEGDLSQIRQLTRERYGFVPPLDPNSPTPLQWVNSDQGLVLNCLSCHAGRLPGSGETVLGLPNSEIDMATFFDDVFRQRGQLFSLGSLWGMTRGRTNAAYFSHVLLQRREPDMSLREEGLADLGTPKFFDLDAPPWWHAKKKTRLYMDGGIEGGHARAIMQFAMAGPDGETFRGWERDFEEILAFIHTLEPPRYPWPIDQKLAREGEKIFVRDCSGCHGTYGKEETYPNRVVPLEVIGTDPLRVTGITKEFRQYYAASWLGEKSKTHLPAGYVAPPLDGVWASAPYFHNGSVPTVYGVLTQEARPKYFRRVGAPTQYDQKNLGIAVEALSGPAPATLPASERRQVIDTTQPGLGNQGHDFGFKLSETEKRQVIEYLKTL